jgi:hypothetical protein
MTREPKRETSFARVMITPILVLIAAGIVGSLLNAMVGGLVVGVVIAVVYVLWASRRRF